MSFLRESIAAHAMRFERPLSPAYGDAAGLRVLAAFLVVGIVLPFALRFAFDAIGARGPAARLAFVVLWLAAFVAAHRWFVRIPFAAVGLRRFGEWTPRERLYFLQVVPIVAMAFAWVFRAHLRTLLELHGPMGFVLFSILGGLAWGIAQELVYRGWLQTELARRFGLVAGVLAANIVFTLGPLHWGHFGGPAGVRWGGLAAVFGIGLLFGILYARSGNVWIPAVMHGLWPLNMS